MIALPPSLAGGLNATEIDALPWVTAGWAGAVGTRPGIAAADAAEAALVPSALVADTVQV